MNSCLILSVIFAVIAPCVAIADDSSAELGAGGLVLTHSDSIRMSAEELRISPRDVSAQFQFVNDGKTDIDTIVAFPLPDIDTSRFSEEPLGQTTNNPLNFVGFDVKADGNNIPFETEQRAFYKGRDVTEIVRRVGVPLNIVDPAFTKTLDALPPAKLKLLKSADLVDEDSGAFAHPHWTVRTRFWWRQKFPAGKTVTLDEHYHPVTGQSLFGTEELNAKDENGRHWLNTYCVDPGTRAVAASMLAHHHASPQNGNYLTALTTDYVLVTGNNWNGPIGHFHLILDKLKPENALSLCWDGRLTKTGPTTFESTRDGFAPKSDIKLLVLQQGP
ncbi:MAG TPA: DUF4424 family protein [Rhizomicrobium sp.]|jgi:hypothetical protein